MTRIILARLANVVVLESLRYVLLFGKKSARQRRWDVPDIYYRLADFLSGVNRIKIC